SSVGMRSFELRMPCRGEGVRFAVHSSAMCADKASVRSWFIINVNPTLGTVDWAYSSTTLTATINNYVNTDMKP
ncbi:hypothetical protein BHE74_00022176, partial [Ensete ventricosum]